MEDEKATMEVALKDNWNMSPEDNYNPVIEDIVQLGNPTSHITIIQDLHDKFSFSHFVIGKNGKHKLGFEKIGDNTVKCHNDEHKKDVLRK
jgi:hypothetical protein